MRTIVLQFLLELTKSRGTERLQPVQLDDGGTWSSLPVHHPQLCRRFLSLGSVHHRSSGETEGSRADALRIVGSPGLGTNGTIGDIEAAVVSFCTRNGHGGRIMPAGTISGVQVSSAGGSESG